MPYNPQTDSNQVISNKHKEMLKMIAKIKGTFMRRVLEQCIEKEYAKISQ